MEYRRFGKTNENISVITLGGMRYVHGWEKPKEIIPNDSIDNCIQTTKAALDRGINHIETAYGYGKSEHLYGITFKELNLKRTDFLLMTKGNAESEEEMYKRFDEQLKALQVDYVDFYGYHGINTNDILNAVIKKNGPIHALLKLKEKGLIKHIGFSTHAPTDVIINSILTDYFDFVNLHYYYFFQKHNAAIELAKHKDMGVFIISPNDKGGQLWNASLKVIDACKPLTPIQFNARFCFSNPNIHTLSFGFNELNHFDELDGMFNDGLYFNFEDRKKLQKLDSFVLDVGSNYCTYCDKCLPCPENINIPEILRFRNMAKGYDMHDFGVYRYNMLESKGHWFPGAFGSACTECGECNPKCPVGLDIPKLLKETHETLFKNKT